MKMKSKRRDEDDDDMPSRSSRPAGKAPAWAAMSESDQANSVKQAETQQAKNRPPEFWLKDGDEKKVRFRHEKAIATIWRYSLKVRGKWRQFTMPAEGEVDLFRDELGLTASLRGVYEVIDKDGYKDRQGKRLRNLPRFFIANQQQHKALEAIRKKRGPLNRYDIEISRQGEGTKSTYMFLPDAPEPMPIEFKEKPSLAKEFEKYYAPLDEAEQQKLVDMIQGRGRSRHNDDDDDDDDTSY